MRKIKRLKTINYRKKLPELPITKFNGKFESWLPFSRKFNSKVVTTKLPTLTKVSYLKKLLEFRLLWRRRLPVWKVYNCLENYKLSRMWWNHRPERCVSLKTDSKGSVVGHCFECPEKTKSYSFWAWSVMKTVCHDDLPCHTRSVKKKGNKVVCSTLGRRKMRSGSRRRLLNSLIPEYLLFW